MNNDLYSLFLKMDLTPGCDVAAVNERYRELASILHPDQMTGVKRKEIAEREMKALNDRRDRILKHLKGAAHKAQGECECRKAGINDVARTRAQGDTKDKVKKPEESTASTNAGGSTGATKAATKKAPKAASAAASSAAAASGAPESAARAAAASPSAAASRASKSTARPAAASASQFAADGASSQRRKSSQGTYNKPRTTGDTSVARNKSRDSNNIAQPIIKNPEQGSTSIFGNVLAAASIMILFLGVISACEWQRKQREAALPKRNSHFRQSAATLTNDSTAFTSAAIVRLPRETAPVNLPATPPPYIKSVSELANIETTDLLKRTRALKLEFRELLDQIQQPEAYTQSRMAGRIPTLYKRFTYVDNQRKIFENELYRRGIKEGNV